MTTAPDDELTVMADEELEAACAMPFVELKKITPWGDVFTGIAPSGREVEVERRYLWSNEPGGGVVVEAGGSIYGGIGVSGAPGGEADDACARAGIKAIIDKLEF